MMTIHDCHRAGMTLRESAAALGISVKKARGRANYARLTMRRDHDMEAELSRLRSKTMKRLNEDPDFAAARDAKVRRYNQTRPRSSLQPRELAHLTDQQRADYDTLKACGYNRAEAFAVLGFAAERRAG